METLNRIEIVGNVGTAKVSEVSGKKVIRLSVATNYIYKANDGFGVIETTWHNVVAFGGENINTNVSKGDKVSIIGRVRNDKYTDANGFERISTEIVASQLLKIAE